MGGNLRKISLKTKCNYFSHNILRLNTGRTFVFLRKDVLFFNEGPQLSLRLQCNCVPNEHDCESN